MIKRLITIGGGSLMNKTTAKIDEYIANLAKEHAGDKRAVGVFIGTASHDSMPYFNTFRKTYTSVHDIKADCVLSVYGEMDDEKIRSKFLKADLIYIGGGDTLFMLDTWKQKNLYDLVIDAYNRGVIIAGLSAGAICWFNKMYTDSEKYTGGHDYNVYDGIGILQGICCPHYEERINDFDQAFLDCKMDFGYAIEGDAALVFENGIYTQAISSGGKAYKIINKDGTLNKLQLTNN